MGNIKFELTKDSNGHAFLVLSGKLVAGYGILSVQEVIKELEKVMPLKSLSFDVSGVFEWDSLFIVFISKIIDFCNDKNVIPLKETLPKKISTLIMIAHAVPDRTGALSEQAMPSLLEKLGRSVVAFGRSSGEVLEFSGEVAVAFARFFTGKSCFRRRDFLVVIEECGINALPIVSLISILVGLILAFVGSIQLKLFGAQIFIANLVGIGVVRAMGAIMTGIIMAGRTGASYAAQLGTMQTNEEIDALKTLGISPIDFLVLPRIIAMTLMMPLLSMFANLMGILGGFIVGIGMFDIGFWEYYNQTVNGIRMKDLWIGLIMSVVFGFLIAATGCLRGMQCERSASAVGRATTSAVVTGIVSIVIATAFITYVCALLGI